jgi:hypothetical protein
MESDFRDRSGWRNRPIQSGRLRWTGIYLITGVAGNIGLAMAEHLAWTVQSEAGFCWEGHGFPAKEAWYKWLRTRPRRRHSVRIRRLQEIEACGSGCWSSAPTSRTSPGNARGDRSGLRAFWPN